MRISACVETLFTDLAIARRLERLVEFGLTSVEFWNAAAYDRKELARSIESLGLNVVLMSGHRDASLIDPEDRDAFLEELKGNIELAGEIGCKSLILTSDSIDPKGNVIPPQRPLSEQEKLLSIYETLRRAAEVAEREQVTLMLEPLNIKVDHPGYFLPFSRTGFELIRAVGSAHLKLLFDLYHLQMMEGHLIPTIEENLAHIGHIHVADVPGRGEPGTGEINFSSIVRALERMGYEGYVGLECFPSGSSEDAIRAYLDLFNK